MSFQKVLYIITLVTFRVYFAMCFGGVNLAKLVFLTMLLLRMVYVRHIYCSQIASIAKFGSNLSKFGSKNLKTSLPPSTRVLFFDQRRC